jgi:hypothetical protein
MDPKAFGEALDEVIFRARRLAEWTSLETPLRELSEATRTFDNKLRSCVKKPAMDFFDPHPNGGYDMHNLWFDIPKSRLADMDELSKGLEFISRDRYGAVDAKVREWVDGLLQDSDALADALIKEISAPISVATSSRIRTKVSQRLAYHLARVRAEVEALCNLTKSLRDQLGNGDRAVPAAPGPAPVPIPPIAQPPPPGGG